MILYNITFNVERDAEQRWLAHMRESYIPEVMETGFFTESHIYRLLQEPENDGCTYAVQFSADSLGDVEYYLSRHAPGISDRLMALFRHKHVAFMTLLESVD
jgi:hypothetical protein